MKSIIFHLIFSLICLVSSAQNIYIIVEDMPEFPGGENALREYINSVPFPEKYKSIEFKYMVKIQFQIDTAGNVQNIGVNNQTDNKALSLIAIEHIEKMPKWRPGSHLGKKVIVQYTFPIPFGTVSNKSKKKRKRR